MSRLRALAESAGEGLRIAFQAVGFSFMALFELCYYVLAIAGISVMSTAALILIATLIPVSVALGGIAFYFYHDQIKSKPRLFEKNQIKLRVDIDNITRVVTSQRYAMVRHLLFLILISENLERLEEKGENLTELKTEGRDEIEEKIFAGIKLLTKDKEQQSQIRKLLDIECKKISEKNIRGRAEIKYQPKIKLDEINIQPQSVECILKDLPLVSESPLQIKSRKNSIPPFIIGFFGTVLGAAGITQSSFAVAALAGASVTTLAAIPIIGWTLLGVGLLTATIVGIYMYNSSRKNAVLEAELNASHDKLESLTQSSMQYAEKNEELNKIIEIREKKLRRLEEKEKEDLASKQLLDEKQKNKALEERLKEKEEEIEKLKASQQSQGIVSILQRSATLAESNENKNPEETYIQHSPETMLTLKRSPTFINLQAKNNENKDTQETDTQHSETAPKWKIDVSAASSVTDFSIFSASPKPNTSNADKSLEAAPNSP